MFIYDHVPLYLTYVPLHVHLYLTYHLYTCILSMFIYDKHAFYKTEIGTWLLDIDT